MLPSSKYIRNSRIVENVKQTTTDNDARLLILQLLIDYNSSFDTGEDNCHLLELKIILKNGI